MTEPTNRDREMAEWLADRAGLPAAGRATERRAWVKAALECFVAHPNLPPLFEVDDWLWVAQSLGYVPFSGDHAGFAERQRMDRIIAKILEYRAEDVRRGRGE